MPDDSIDALVTDPPAGIAFMPGTNKSWDSDRGGREQWIEWLAEIMREALRVMKPGAYGVVWAHTKTSHWTGTALEHAGFEIRECIFHLHAQGGAKCLNVAKAIDEKLGVEPTVVGPKPWKNQDIRGGSLIGGRDHEQLMDTAPTSEEAKRWDGWYSGIKTCVECWWLVQKPFKGTIVNNVLTHGVGAVNVGATSVARAEDDVPGWHESGANGTHGYVGSDTFRMREMSAEEISARRAGKGRFTPNLVLSHASFPVMRLADNLPPVVEELIRGYYHGYDGVSLLRKRLRDSSLSNQGGPEVLHEAMQDRSVPNDAIQRSDTCSVPGVWEGKSGIPKRSGDGSQEVLQSNLFQPLSTETDRREESALREETHAEDAGSNFGNAHQERMLSKGSGTPSLERRDLQCGGRLSEDAGVCPKSQRSEVRHSDGCKELCPGASSGDGQDTWSSLDAKRSSSPQERRQVGQQAGELDADGLGRSLTEAPPTGTGACFSEERKRGIESGDRPLEVLAPHIPPGWLDYFVATNEHLGCCRVGTTRVKGCPQTVIQGGKDGGGYDVGSGDGTRRGVFAGYGDENGLETVDLWACVPGCPVRELDNQSGKTSKTGKRSARSKAAAVTNTQMMTSNHQSREYNDEGGASRYYPQFHYFPKPARGEKEKGLDHLEAAILTRVNPGGLESDPRFAPVKVKNNHTTVKGIPLCCWLSRLVCPPDGLLLDPFAGSGSIGCAAGMEGFRYIGIEQGNPPGDSRYIEISKARMEYWAREAGRE